MIEKVIDHSYFNFFLIHSSIIILFVIINKGFNFIFSKAFNFKIENELILFCDAKVQLEFETHLNMLHTLYYKKLQQYKKKENIYNLII